MMVYTWTIRVALLLLGELGHTVLGWRDCSILPEDRWVTAAPNSLPARLLDDQKRRYTCTDEKGSWEAANYVFNSTCTARDFDTPDIRDCLKGRRMIFLGDSLAVQQGDSMLAMLGWHASFLKQGDPKSQKWAHLEDGTRVPALYECWRDPVAALGGCERCYDVFGRDYPPEEKGERGVSESGEGVSETPEPYSGRSPGGHLRRATTATAPSLEEHGEVIDTAPEQGQEDALKGEVGGAAREDEEDKTSVHMRMFSKPSAGDWLSRVTADFNGTRPSDIYVINFGAHFHDDAEGDDDFKRETSTLLDDMARLGERATVVWREMSPTHFPGEDGSYDSVVPSGMDPNCCSGTPPPLLERNVWVEKYLNEKNLTHRIKLLRIYRMSTFRGSAHRSCHIGPPTAPGGEPQAAGEMECLPWRHSALDCRHWSETGVVEEWNKLMLNHICPA